MQTENEIVTKVRKNRPFGLTYKKNVPELTPEEIIIQKDNEKQYFKDYYEQNKGKYSHNYKMKKKKRAMDRLNTTIELLKTEFGVTITYVVQPSTA